MGTKKNMSPQGQKLLVGTFGGHTHTHKAETFYYSNMD